MKLTLAYALIFAILASYSLPTSADVSFGKGADMTLLVKLEEITIKPDIYVDRQVTIKGVIDKVCKKKGCWMTLKANDETPAFRIKVPDGVMVFPVSKIGKVAFATGKIQAIPMTLEQTRKYLAHYAEEQQETFDENSVKKAITLYQLVPDGVTISD